MTNKTKVLILTKYSRLGASSRLRFLQYINDLENDNFEVEVQNLLSDNYLNNLYNGHSQSKINIINRYLNRLIFLTKSKKYDVLWVEKELFPYFPACFEYLLYIFNIKYVVDYDDATFHTYDKSNQKLVRKLFSKKIAKVMKYSSHVITGNQYLANYAKKAGSKHISIIPTVVDHSKYNVKDVDSNADMLTVGWIGSPSTQKYVIEILPALQAAYRIRPFKLLLIGASIDITKKLFDLNVEVTPWNEKSESKFIESMDIGIMPLKNELWEQGKCGFKLIQYMACGIPVVASPVGVNEVILKESNSGLLATTLKEWECALLSLLSSDSDRKKYGLAGRQSVLKRYSLESQINRLTNILNESKL